jgi:hypothetical protein
MCFWLMRAVLRYAVPCMSSFCISCCYCLMS